MGNAFALVKDSKLFLKELQRIFEVAVNILLGITSILEDVEDVLIASKFENNNIFYDVDSIPIATR